MVLWTLFPLLLRQSADKTQPETYWLLQSPVNPVALGSLPGAANAKLTMLKAATATERIEERIEEMGGWTASYVDVDTLYSIRGAW